MSQEVAACSACSGHVGVNVTWLLSEDDVAAIAPNDEAYFILYDMLSTYSQSYFSNQHIDLLVVELNSSTADTARFCAVIFPPAGSTPTTILSGL